MSAVRKTVLVECPLPNGIVLQLYKEVRGEFNSVSFRPDGDAVRLNAGSNEVDAEFWSKWLAQHQGDNPLALFLKETKDARVGYSGVQDSERSDPDGASA